MNLQKILKNSLLGIALLQAPMVSKAEKIPRLEYVEINPNLVLGYYRDNGNICPYSLDVLDLDATLIDKNCDSKTDRIYLDDHLYGKENLDYDSVKRSADSLFRSSKIIIERLESLDRKSPVKDLGIKGMYRV